MLHGQPYTRDASRTSRPCDGHIPILWDLPLSPITPRMNNGTNLDISALKKVLIDRTGPGKKWSRRALSIAAGMGPDGVRDIISGRSKNPSAMFVIALARLLEIDIGGILKDKGERKAIEIPVVGKVAAGVWREVGIEDTQDQTIGTFPDLTPDAPDGRRFALEVEGDSMNLTFRSGMYLDCIDPISSGMEPLSGDYVIVERRQGPLRETTCKRLDRTSDGVWRLIAESDRPEFAEPIIIGKPDVEIDGDDGVVVIGIVLGAYVKTHRNRMRV